MLTNFVNAAAESLCRGLNNTLGHFPSACLTNGGEPALVLATAALVLVGAGAMAAWNRFHR